MANELTEKVKTVIYAINSSANFKYNGKPYIVTGYQITRDNCKLHLSVRLTDTTAKSSWLWIDERVYFMEV